MEDLQDWTFLNTTLKKIKPLPPDLVDVDNYVTVLGNEIGQRIPRDAVKSYFDKFGLKILLPSSLPDNLWFGDIYFNDYDHRYVVVEIGNKNNRKDVEDFYQIFDIMRDFPFTYIVESSTKPENWDVTEKITNSLTNLKKIETNNFLFIGGTKSETTNAAIVIKDGIFIRIISNGCSECNPSTSPLSIDDLIKIAKSLK